MTNHHQESNALDIGELNGFTGFSDFGLNNNCVAFECNNQQNIDNSKTISDNTNSNIVSESDNTNIGTNGDGNESGTLTVAKEVRCESTRGTPSNDAVCNAAESSNLLPEPKDFIMIITGNEPNPPSFPGSSTGTEVTLNPGIYKVSESSVNVNLQPLANLLDAESTNVELTVTGDCIYDTDPPAIGGIGSITSSGSQVCKLINTIEINGGTVPPI